MSKDTYFELEQKPAGDICDIKRDLKPQSTGDDDKWWHLQRGDIQNSLQVVWFSHWPLNV